MCMWSIRQYSGYQESFGGYSTILKGLLTALGHTVYTSLCVTSCDVAGTFWDAVDGKKKQGTQKSKSRATGC